MITFGRILSLSLIITSQALVAAAQRPLTAKANNLQTQPTSAKANDNDRVRDGLVGPVRRIRTEVVKVVTTDGKIVESGKRVLLEAAEYDLNGAKTVNQYFPVAGSTSTGREVYKYDDKGNISEMTLTGSDGSLISKETYKYEYDSLGNWTRMTTSVAVVENGSITFEPTEVTQRTISYYLDATMTKVLQPSSNTTSTSATNATANNSGANTKSNQQQTIVAPLQLTHRAPITLSSQPIQPVAEMRNVSFASNPKVAVENAPTPPAQPARTVSGGVLNGSALNLPAPLFPEAARRMRTSGVVEVDVVIDENGKVVSAKATSGPPLFRDNAVQAALRAKFTPSKLSGQPVKVTGKIIYNFRMP
ncbi:MAG TPA: TonB family protein [Pyrinomonadaceae bacterium]|nr:TonB family protein [Pyrinomonadaceae bacterium]